MERHREHWNPKMETLPSERYHELQEKALLRQLKYVWENSTFYQKKFREVGIELRDIGRLEDLRKLPFTEKAELRELRREPAGNWSIRHSIVNVSPWSASEQGTI